MDEKGEESCSWSELEIRFVSKYQLSDSLAKRSRGKGEHSKGAFVGAIKKLKKGAYIKKIPIKGKFRYIITAKGKNEIGKQNITQGIIYQELTQTEVPSKIPYDFFFSRIKSQVDVARGLYKNPFKRLKLIGKEEEFFSNSYVHMMAQHYSKFLKISILHPKGQKPPNLDIKFDEKNIISGKELLVSYFAHVAGEYEKEVGKILPFQLLLTFDPPPFNPQDLKKEIETQIESLYQKWLLEFNQKHSEKKEKEFNSKLIKYDAMIHQKRLKALQKT